MMGCRVLPTTVCTFGTPLTRIALVRLLLLFLATYSLLLATSASTIGVYDESLILTGALRVLHGEIPSRDFYVMYGPAPYFILAWVFHWFGTNLLVARVYDNLVTAAIVPLVWLSMSHARSRWLAMSCILAVLALLILYRVHLYPLTASIVIVLAASLVMVKGFSQRWTAFEYLSLALLIACLMLFRYDLAVIAIPAFGLPLVALAYLQMREGLLDRTQAVGIVLRNSGVLFVVMIGVLGVLWATGILMPVLDDLVTYNTTNYVKMRRLPFPSVGSLIRSRYHFTYFIAVYFALAAAAIAVTTVLLARRQRDRAVPFSSDPRIVSLVVFACAALSFYAKGLVRTSPVHLLLANVPAVIAAFLSADTLIQLFPAGRFGILRRALIGALVAATALCFSYALRMSHLTAPIYRQYGLLSIPSDLPALRVFGAGSDEIRASEYLVAHTGPSDRVLSATGRHDKVFVNDCSIYFVAQRLPCTRWHSYDPGVQTTTAVQEDIIRNIAANRVKFILRNRSWDEVEEQNSSRFSSGVLLLDSYINKQFRKVAEFGQIEICESVLSKPD